jgi:hypothetical protein
MAAENAKPAIPAARFQAEKLSKPAHGRLIKTSQNAHSASFGSKKLPPICHGTATEQKGSGGVCGQKMSIPEPLLPDAKYPLTLSGQ